MSMLNLLRANSMSGQRLLSVAAEAGLPVVQPVLALPAHPVPTQSRTPSPNPYFCCLRLLEASTLLLRFYQSDFTAVSLLTTEAFPVLPILSLLLFSNSRPLQKKKKVKKERKKSSFIGDSEFSSVRGLTHQRLVKHQKAPKLEQELFPFQLYPLLGQCAYDLIIP